jgi:hypothetical protein
MDDLLSTIDDDILKLICDKIECVITLLNLKLVNKFWNKLAEDLLSIIRKNQEDLITLKYNECVLQKTGIYEIVNKILQDYYNSYIENNFLDVYIGVDWACRDNIIIPITDDKIINDTDIDNIISHFRNRYKPTDFRLIKDIAYTHIDYGKREFNMLVITDKNRTLLPIYYGANKRKSHIEYPVIYKDKKLTYPSPEKFILFNLNKDDIINRYLEKHKQLHWDLDYISSGYIIDEADIWNEICKMIKK